MKTVFTSSLIVAAVALPLHASAAEIKVLAAPNMRPILTDLTPDFERMSGRQLLIAYDSAGAVKNRVAAGEATDVVVTLRPLLDDLSAQGKVTGVAGIGRSFIGVVVRAGAAKPEIGSIDAFKRSLLAAQSIVHSDPAKEGLSGIFVVGLLERMGIAEQIKPKTKLVAPGGAALIEALVKGEAEMGIDQLAVLVGKSGIDVVGILPKEFGVDIVMAAGVVAGAREPEAAAALVKFLTSPAAAPVIKARGMEPG